MHGSCVVYVLYLNDKRVLKSDREISAACLESVKGCDSVCNKFQALAIACIIYLVTVVSHFKYVFYTKE